MTRWPNCGGSMSVRTGGRGASGVRAAAPRATARAEKAAAEWIDANARSRHRPRAAAPVPARIIDDLHLGTSAT